MAWTTPGTAVAGDVLTAAFWNQQVRDNENFLYQPPMVRCKRSTDLTVTSNTDWLWDGEDFDTDSMHSTSSNTARITINTSGVYLIAYAVSISFSGTLTSFQTSIYKSNTTIIGQNAWYGSRAVNFQQAGSFIAKLNAGDYVTGRAFIDGATSITMSSGDTSGFSALWIGSA